MKSRRFSIVLCGLLLAAGGAAAQTFGEAGAAAPSPAAQSGIRFAPVQKSVAPANPVRNTAPETVSDADLSRALTEEKAALAEDQKLENVFIPGGGLDVLSRATEDGSKRGGVAVVEVNEEGRSRRASKIFLYYENFRMSSYMSNMAACDVRFIVLTNLDRKLVSLDVKLVWPGLTTALSFSNVEPNTPTYLDYTLMGNGCYNMDQMPNIVVNRCRVRGMNSAECADKIVWLSAQSVQ